MSLRYRRIDELMEDLKSTLQASTLLATVKIARTRDPQELAKQITSVNAPAAIIRPSSVQFIQEAGNRGRYGKRTVDLSVIFVGKTKQEDGSSDDLWVTIDRVQETFQPKTGSPNTSYTLEAVYWEPASIVPVQLEGVSAECAELVVQTIDFRVERGD